MKVKMELCKLETAAMIEANITATWPCPPGHKWHAEWKTYFDDYVTVTCEKIENGPPMVKPLCVEEPEALPAVTPAATIPTTDTKEAF